MQGAATVLVLLVDQVPVFGKQAIQIINVAFAGGLEDFLSLLPKFDRELARVSVRAQGYTRSSTPPTVEGAGERDSSI